MTGGEKTIVRVRLARLGRSAGCSGSNQLVAERIWEAVRMVGKVQGNKQILRL